MEQHGTVFPGHLHSRQKVSSIDRAGSQERGAAAAATEAAATTAAALKVKPRES